MSTRHPDMLEIVLTGRNDGYGGEDFIDRMCTAADFNHCHLTAAGVPHTYTFVEWNPIPGRPLLAELLRARLPWFHTCYVASADWHTRISTNPRLQFMEFFAKNVAIRRSRARWILTTNSDIFLSPEVIEVLAAGSLAAGTLHRAVRLDIDRTIPWRQPSWDLFRDPANQLRRHALRAPYFGDAAGDFLLLDRESYHRLGGFNEIVRFAKIYKDGQFCIQAHAHGLPIASLGDIYHLDHDGSFATATARYGPRHEDAPFGPWWDANGPYVNRSDWGMTAATEEIDAAPGVVWLRSPEERGPALSVIVNGAVELNALTMGVTSLLSAAGSIEVLVADASPAVAAAAAELSSTDPRVRLIAGSHVAGLNQALARARGRLLCVLPTPAFFLREDLSALLERFNGDPSLDAVICSAPDALAPVAVFRRTVYQALGDVDTHTGLPLHDYWRGIPAGLRIEPAGVAPRVVPSDASAPNAWLFNAELESQWTATADARAACPAAIAADVVRDYRRRSAGLAAAIERRLQATLPAGTRAIALCGVDLLTIGAIQAARRLGIRVLSIYTTDLSLVGDSFGGVPIFSAEHIAAGSTVPTVLTTSSPADAHCLRTKVKARFIVELTDPSADPRDAVACTPPPTHLAEARFLRDAGRHEQAFAVLQMLVAWSDDTSLVRDLADLAARTGRTPLAMTLHRRLLLRQPADAPMLRYRVASMFKQGGRSERARWWFERLLTDPGLPPFLEGGSHFHLGDLAQRRGDAAAAAWHFCETLRLIPDHSMAKELLDALRRAA